MITDGRKYVINDSAGLFCDITQVPETLLTPGDDYINTGGLAVGMQVRLCDSEVPVTLCMTEKDVKALIFALKQTRKKYKKVARSKM